MSGVSSSSTGDCGGGAVVAGHLPAGEKHCEDSSVLLPASSHQPPLRRNSWAAKGSFRAKLGGRGRGHYSLRCVALQNRLFPHRDEQWPVASTSLPNIDATPWRPLSIPGSLKPSGRCGGNTPGLSPDGGGDVRVAMLKHSHSCPSPPPRVTVLAHKKGVAAHC